MTAIAPVVEPPRMERREDHIVYFDAIRKDYGSLRAVDELSFGVPKGSLFGFLGANGAGKSTTLKMLLGLCRPTAGTFYLFGENGLGRSDLRRHVGALIEYPAFYDYMSGRANLEIFGRLAGGVTSDQIDALLEAVGLTVAARRKVGGYSQGMRQRLGVAQALLGQPKLLILDEPTNGLDPEGSREMWALLRRLVAEEEMTILISSHLLNEVEEACDQVAVIDLGRLVCCERVEDLKRGEAGRVEIEFVDEATTLRARDYLAGREDVIILEDPLAEAAVTKIKVSLEGLTAAELNRGLFEADLPFHFIQPKDRTLKDYFFRMRAGSRERIGAE